MNDELRRWAEEWQRAQEPLPDLENMLIRARRKDALEMGVTGAATAFLLLVGIGGLFYFKHPVMLAPSAFLIVFGLMVVGWLSWRRTRLRRSWQGSTEAHVSELRKRLDEDVVSGRTWWPYLVFLGFLMAWLPWKVHVDWEGYRAEPWRLVLGITGIVSILVSAAIVQRATRRRAERKRTALDKLTGYRDDEVGGGEGSGYRSAGR